MENKQNNENNDPQKTPKTINEKYQAKGEGTVPNLGNNPEPKKTEFKKEEAKNKKEDIVFSTPPPKAKKPVALLIGVILLAIIVVIMAYIFFEKKAESERIANEKAQLLEEFMDLKDQYSFLETDNDSMSAQLENKQVEIEELIKKLNRAKANNRYIVSQYKKELGTLREVLKSYIVQVDSLNTRNKELTAENLRIKTDYTKESKRRQELEEANEDLSSTVEKAAILMADNIDVAALNSRSKAVTKVKKTMKLRTCFTIRANAVAESGFKMVYIRILRPDGVLLAISEEAIFEVNGEQKIYSERREVEYLNEDVDMCIYWDNTGDLIKGEYTVEIYTQGHQIGSGTILLK